MTITVKVDAGNPLASATVRGSWSKGFDLTGSCETDASGQCTKELAVSSKTRRVTFTIDSVSHTVLTYNAALNVTSTIRWTGCKS